MAEGMIEVSLCPGSAAAEGWRRKCRVGPEIPSQSNLFTIYHLLVAALLWGESLVGASVSPAGHGMPAVGKMRENH